MVNLAVAVALDDVKCPHFFFKKAFYLHWCILFGEGIARAVIVGVTKKNNPFLSFVLFYDLPKPFNAGKSTVYI